MASEKLNVSTPEGCINSANHLIELCGLHFPRISSVQDINSRFFVAVFEYITECSIPDLLLSDDTTTEVHNIQAVIDTLSLDLLGISLSHITGEDVVSGNTVAILNLLEVLEAMFLQLFPHKKKRLKEAKDKVTRNGSSSTSIVSSSDENILPPLKRKICRRTLQKYDQNHQVREKEISTSSSTDNTELFDSKLYSDAYKENMKSPLKRKISKPESGLVKRPHTEGIEQLNDLNFEMKVRALLLSDKSPVLRSHQMKKNYLQSLKTPLKRKTIPPCKKSFLLPYNLRHKPTVQHHYVKAKIPQRKKGIKLVVSEKDEKLQKDCDTPVIIQTVLGEFPGFQFPKNTLNLLTKCYYQHVGLMHKQLKNVFLKKPTTLIQAEKAVKNESKLSNILAKDLQERNHLREIKEHKILENRIKFSLRDARLQSVKMRQYFDEFQRSMSKKLQKRNFSEEMLVEKTFKEILDLQKEKVQLLCERVRETDDKDAKQHRKYLYALKNLYQQQLELLTESINTEQKNSLERTKLQKLAAEKMNQELRKKLQRDISSLQKDVLEMIEDIHFRELDAQNFIKSFQQQD